LEATYFEALSEKNMPVDTNTIIPLGVTFISYDKIVPTTTDSTEKQAESKRVFLNPYPSSKAATLGIINNDETISTPINLIEITILTVANIINK
jgi:hypothetical protein